MSELLQGIASITKTVQQTLNSYEVRKLGDKVQGYVMNFTETEQKVREATNEDPWGPTGPQMQEIASFTFQYDLFSEVMGMLWKRMFQETKLAWRRVYKSLVLLNYLLKNGSERVISTAKDHQFEMRALESYKCVDERGKDEGLNVRHRVKLILELLNDEELLRAERRKAKTEGREKYQGFSKEDMIGGRGGSSSKFDSFERWNEKKHNSAKSVDLDSEERGGGGGGSGRREVTAFDFDSEHRSHTTGSPELGIRERTPEPTDEHGGGGDDDEFGDFTSARATTKSNATTVAPPIKAIKKPSLTSTPPSATHHSKQQQGIASPPRAQSSAAGGPAEFDFLGLGTTEPALFAPAQSAPCMVSEAGQSHGTKNVLDDIFSSPPPPTQNNGTNNINNNGHSAGNHGLGGIDLLSSPAVVHNNGGNANSLDFLGTGFGATNPTIAYAPNVPKEQKPSNESTTAKRPTLGSTWEDLKGKVNIDFDNLSLKPAQSKPTPSLNELKKQTPKDPTNAPGNFLF